jgi:hypothetical protein
VHRERGRQCVRSINATSAASRRASTFTGAGDGAGGGGSGVFVVSTGTTGASATTGTFVGDGDDGRGIGRAGGSGSAFTTGEGGGGSAFEDVGVGVGAVFATGATGATGAGAGLIVSVGATTTTGDGDDGSSGRDGVCEIANAVTPVNATSTVPIFHHTAAANPCPAVVVVSARVAAIPSFPASRDRLSGGIASSDADDKSARLSGEASGSASRR